MPTSQVYFQNYFSNIQLMWNEIYNLPRIVLIDSRLRCFQYKILHNILYLNEKLYLFKEVDTKLCPFCEKYNETIIHLFTSCSVTVNFWNNIKDYFNGNLNIPSLSPQSAIFEFFEVDHNTFYILNHLLLLYKHFTYISRDLKKLSFSKFAKNLRKVYNIEKKISQQSEKKKKLFKRKWHIIQRKVENI